MCVDVPVWVYSQTGDRVGVCVSTHVPLFSVRPLGHVQTGPLGLSKHSHSHFFLSHGLATDKHTHTHKIIASTSLLFSTEFAAVGSLHLFSTHSQVACSDGAKLYL